MLKILDCTLRDGGYINDWNFGEANIKQIVNSLSDANVDLIELGYIDKKGSDSLDSTKRSSLEAFLNLGFSKNSRHVVMINYGDFDLCEIPPQNKTNLFGIRVAFKKSNLIPAIHFCDGLIKKGYEVFVQPMVTASYIDEEFLALVDLANTLHPFAFYLVDSFGEMSEKDLIHFYSLAESKLLPDIHLGFHSHNNLQLAYSNCKKFISFKSKHNLIVDSSLFGMGRGAGNLNTEIFLDYLINEFDMHFNINPIINVIDRVINKIYVERHWGYSIPYYISAKNHCHPNYAHFLDGKKNLTFFEIEKIIKSIAKEKKEIFDKDYINNIYIEYQNKEIACDNFEETKKLFSGKNIVLVAPGPSFKLFKNTIKQLRLNEDNIIVTINFVPEEITFDYAFFSNSKRFADINLNINSEQLVVTSNIVANNVNNVIPYFSLLNEKDVIYDNGGLMCIKLMIICGAKSIKLVGFDGYGHSPAEDYADESLRLPFRNSNEYMNQPIKEVINEYRKNISITFLSKSRYED